MDHDLIQDIDLLDDGGAHPVCQLLHGYMRNMLGVVSLLSLAGPPHDDDGR